MRIATTVTPCRHLRAGLGSVAFVPTMGALHAGHLSLIDRAHELAEHVVASIFVNPTQFGPNEDFQQYPRPIERDLELCREHGVDLVFTPDANEVYPPDELDVSIDVPQLTGVLEGARRPGHFEGVCRVVTKLLNIVQPQFACFGQKDYQQLQVITAMTRGMNLPIRIVPCPTLREADGLAMSSRNAYLSGEQRKQALGLSRALDEARQLIVGDGVVEPEHVERAMEQVLQSHQVEVEYAVVRDRKSLDRKSVV